VLDTLLMARELHPGKRNSLDALCDRYGVSNAHRTLHGALLDSELLAEVYLAMTRGQDSFAMALDDQPAGKADALQLQWPPKGLRVVAPTALELSDHQAALAAIEKDRRKPTLWGTSSPA
jgi:DNA polymerase-3 subunit epsilon